MTPVEAGRTTIREFSYYAEAEKLRKEAKDKKIALQAWLNQTAQATNKKGTESAYRDFEDFYNKNLGAEQSTEKEMSIAERNYLMNKRRREREKGGN